jgi:hypothetical protein
LKSGFEQAEQQLESKSHDEHHEPGQGPSQGEDGLLPFFVSEIEAGKFGAEPGVDSIFGQLAEAEKGIARQQDAPEEGQGICENTQGHMLFMEPIHGRMVQEVY